MLLLCKSTKLFESFLTLKSLYVTIFTTFFFNLIILTFLPSSFLISSIFFDKPTPPQTQN
ncbi:hypothetical protein BBU29805_0856 [Borreliella burgdorferi 29805]|nr:hypothetical protein BBU29805_0856 [Borreliella burgdorferi 29805]